MLSALIIIFACACGFALSSLWPWRHLIDGGYVLQFIVLTAGLAAVATVGLAWARHRWPGRDVWLGLACGLLVFVPVSLWNDNGPINVIMLHLDSLRAASTSLHGYGRQTTPRLQELVDERGALMFEQFFSQSAGTDKSTPAMLASIYPSMFYDPARDGLNYLVPDRFPLLSEYLSDLGYSSFMFSSNPSISASRNYDRGWDRFEEVWDGRHSPHELVDLMKARIMEADTEPFFFFGLILDPHMPYEPAEEFNVFVADTAVDQRFITERLRQGDPVEMWIDSAMALYDGEILEVDDAVGGLVDWLVDEGLWESTMLVVTADHGEKFLEKGELGHGGTLYEEVIHIPLVWSFPSPLRFPRIEPRLDRYTRLASHVDLAPTILGFLDGEVPEGPMQGHNLTPHIFGQDEPLDYAVLIEELTPKSWRRALRTRRWKAMWKDTQEGSTARLFNVAAGVRELEVPVHEGAAADRLTILEEERDRLLGRILTFYKDKPAEAVADPETLERLRELGYTR